MKTVLLNFLAGRSMSYVAYAASSAVMHI